MEWRHSKQGTMDGKKVVDEIEKTPPQEHQEQQSQNTERQKQNPKKT